MIIIPQIAPLFGRVALPMFNQNNVRPCNMFTCILNRNYVSKKMYKSMMQISSEYNNLYTNEELIYLDANFPFINKFPLLPHLSHNDGNKLDLAFKYLNYSTQKPIFKSPSWNGYGICEEPKSNEINTAEICTNKGYWQYNLLKQITLQTNKNNFLFDEVRTKYLLDCVLKNKNVNAVFIEPHLKKRMNILSQKVKFHGCHAVRHDDHIHIQL